MGSLWCKIWTWLLNTVQSAVDTIAYALDTIGTVAVDLLSDLATAVGGAVGDIFGGGNLLIWLGVGVFAYMLLTKQSDKDKNASILDRYVVKEPTNVN